MVDNSRVSGELPSPANCSPATRFDVSTDHIPERERFDYFSSVVAKQFVGFDASSSFCDHFSARYSGCAAGAVGITSAVCSPGRWVRSRKSLLDGEESIVVTLAHSGVAHIIPGEEPLTLKPGVVSLTTTTVACEKQVVERHHCSSIRVPRTAVETALRPGLLVKPMIFAPNDPAIRLLFSYARSFMHGFSEMSGDTARLAGAHMADLLALALGAHRDAEMLIAEGGLKAARTDAILRAIATRFACPSISPATIGAALGISERHVHRLLEETNRTFYEHLLEARLSNAFRMVRDIRSTRAIGEVAAKSGFTNVTYFNRVFRQRFGDTPSGVRAASATGPVS